MNFKHIYKIINKNEWHKARDSGTYLGSSKDLEDGYIHFSGEDQVKSTLKKFFDKQKDLILLKVDTLKLDNLIWEQASDGNIFPHLYSSLDISSITNEFDIILKEDGNHRLPDDF